MPTQTGVLRALLPSGVAVAEMDPRESSLSALFPEEAAHVAKAVEKRQREFCAGRICARRAMELLGAEPTVLLSDEDRVPRWPDGLTGSISHTLNWCGAAVTRDPAIRGVGIDIERASSLKSRVFQMICTEDELSWLDALPEDERGVMGKLIFSAKESAYKAQYALTRTYLGFAAMSIEFCGPQFRATLNQDVGDAFRIGDVILGRHLLTEDHVVTAVVI